ncbi:FxsA family protein [Stella sp.]|uniref:FxsA family protein n=1 Tax=Stella sp. TaxID=2912054 RepID=UPI0035B38549
MRATVPFLILSIPLIEIALFLVVGDLIGVAATLAATVAAALLGILLIRGRGVAALRQLRPGDGVAAVPVAAMLRGATMVLAGMLLLVPGFLTDLLGLSLLLPPVRRRIGAAIGRRFRPVPAGPGFGPGPIIDGDAVIVDDGAAPERRPPAGPPAQPIPPGRTLRSGPL